MNAAPIRAPKSKPVLKPSRLNQAGKNTADKNAMGERKKGAFETCLLMFYVAAFLALNLLLIGRYAEITAAKHQVAALEKRIDQLQNQREQLMVEVEKASRLDWIEKEASNRLGMRYPDKNRMIYISVDPSRVSLLASQIEPVGGEGDTEGSLLLNSIERVFHKFAGVFRSY